jgi:hypothetical protein
MLLSRIDGIAYVMIGNIHNEQGTMQTKETSAQVAMRMNRVIVETNCRDKSECCICYTPLYGKTVANLPCGHKLHSKCHLQLRASNCVARAQCPECRAPFLQSLPVREQNGILRGILRMRLDDAESEMEDDPEDGTEDGTDDDPEDDPEDDSEDDPWLDDDSLVHQPGPVAAAARGGAGATALREGGEDALVRHLTRLQISNGVDPGMWAHPNMGLGGLFQEAEAEEEEDSPRLGRALVPPGTDPMVLADAIEWAVSEGLIGENEEPSAQQLFEWLGPMNNY